MRYASKQNLADMLARTNNNDTHDLPKRPNRTEAGERQGHCPPGLSLSRILQEALAERLS
jgi:hypothetical protein